MLNPPKSISARTIQMLQLVHIEGYSRSDAYIKSHPEYTTKFKSKMTEQEFRSTAGQRYYVLARGKNAKKFIRQLLDNLALETGITRSAILDGIVKIANDPKSDNKTKLNALQQITNMLGLAEATKLEISQPDLIINTVSAQTSQIECLEQAEDAEVTDEEINEIIELLPDDLEIKGI